jgi:hypothetical protein
VTAGVFLFVLLAAAAAAFVLAPLARRGIAEAEASDDSASAERELLSRRQMLLAALKDLEDDRATDKIDEADHAELKARLSAQAIEVMRRLDVVDSERLAAEEAARVAALPLRHPGARRTDPVR